MERTLGLIVTALALGAHVVLLSVLGESDKDFLERVSAGGFGLWICGPFLSSLALLLAFRRLSGAWIAAGVMIGCALSVWAYGEAFFGDRVDAQAALVFLFVPIYQYGIVTLASAAAAWHGIRRARRQAA